MEGFMMLIVLSLLSLSHQSKLSTFQVLTNYESSTVKQTLMKDNSLLVFLGLKAFKYSSDEAFTFVSSKPFQPYALTDSSYMNDALSSVMIRTVDDHYLMACGNKHLELFNKSGKVIASLSGLTSFDPSTKCSLSELRPNTFLLAYLSTNQSIYLIKLISFNSITNMLVEDKGINITGGSAPIICQAFPQDTVKLILCIYHKSYLKGILYNRSDLTIKIGDMEISLVSNTHYFILPIDEMTLYVFSMKGSNGVFQRPIVQEITYDITISIGYDRVVIDSTEQEMYTCPLAVSRLSERGLIAFICNERQLFFRKYAIPFQANGPVITIDSGITTISSVSLGVFNPHSIGIIVNYSTTENYLFTVQYPICNDRFYGIQKNSSVQMSNLVDMIDVGLNPRIVFKSRDPLFSYGESTPRIKVGTEYKLDQGFTFILGGLFSYVYNFIEEVGGFQVYSLDCVLTIEICFDRCMTCVKYGSQTDHQCLTCSIEFHLIETRPFQCVDAADFADFYLDASDDTYKKCYLSCAACSGVGSSTDTNCDSCNTDYYPHPFLPKQCVNTLIEGYYIDTVNKVYAKCYGLCMNCNAGGIEGNHKCTECNKGFVLNKVTTGNCINVCKADNDTNIYFDENGDYHCTPTKKCLIEKPYLITDTNECIETCPSNMVCEFLSPKPDPEPKPDPKPDPEPICPKCPNDKISNSLSCICFTEEEISILIDNIMKGIVSISQGEVLIHYNNTTLEIIKSSTPSHILPNISWFMPEEITKLKEQLGIPQSEDIIIYKKDIQTSDKLVNEVEFSFFYINETQVDMHNFPNVSITLISPIKNTQSSSYQQASQLSLININVANESDPFFTDICFKFVTDNNTDLTRKDRYRYYLMDNSTLCPSICSYRSVDYLLNFSYCVCTTIGKPPSPPTPFEVLKLSLVNSFLDANWEVITCYMIVFNNNIIPTNIGHWVVFLISLISIANMILFCHYSFEPIEKYLDYLESKFTVRTHARKKHSDKAKIQIISNALSIKPINATQCVGVNTSLQALIVNSSQDNTMNVSNQSSIQKSIKSLKLSRQTSFGQGENYCSPSLGTNTINNVTVHKSKTQFNNKPPIFRKSTFLAHEDYLEMSYEKLLQFDSRTFFQHYRDELMLTQPIISTFFLKSKRMIKSIRIALFTLDIVIDFSLSAFFYSDKYLSQQYIGMSIIYNLPISVYTFLLSSVLNILLYFLTTTHYGLMKIQRATSLKALRKKSSFFIKSYKVRVVLFFIINVILLLFFWYYTSAFCGKYRNNQIQWIINASISFGIAQIIPFFLSLVKAMLLNMSIAKQNKVAYYIYIMI